MNSSLQLEQFVNRVMEELEKKLIATQAPTVRTREWNALSEERASVRVAVDSTDREETSGELADSGVATIKVPQPKWEAGLSELIESTPARIGVWRTGTRPLTKEVLKFRCDHAAAIDSIYGEVKPELLEQFGLFTVETRFENTENYLKRPDMGRIVTETGVELIRKSCKSNPQVQIVVSDGLSANAIDANLPDVYPSLLDSLDTFGLTVGTPFFVRGGRVAVMDHIGELLQPDVLVLLIGERPGLVSSKSMSAYLCYRPRRGTVESDRTVISNIHPGGTPPVEAGAYIGTFVHTMLEQKTSGIHLDI
jgi:ethanolamine ammonia-lyase small subunit